KDIKPEWLQGKQRVGVTSGASTPTQLTRQVIVPQHYDQHYWARRIDQLGIGGAHPPGEPTTDSLAAALSHALQPGIAVRAKLIGDSVRTDGAKAAALRLMASASQSPA
ncbi:MAG TPA: hypothetical protein VN834_06450, partial [Candidatus Acidoferrum sp.]|nr:hypothetical protein [Candidatus Acidoferrum sp.]